MSGLKLAVRGTSFNIIYIMRTVVCRAGGLSGEILSLALTLATSGRKNKPSISLASLQPWFSFFRITSHSNV